MDFPVWAPAEIDARSAASEALDASVRWTGRTDNGFFLLAELDDERAVRELTPDLNAIAGLEAPAVIVTAAADGPRDYDFVSRVFAPREGIPEDPVTGSSHTVLAPFWAARIGRTALVGMQTSHRPGRVAVELVENRVTVAGRAVTVLDGALTSKALPLS